MQRDTYWIAVRYLGLSEGAFPASATDDEDDCSPQARKRWEEIADPSGFADFQELSDGARRALHDKEHRQDLPFWIDRIRHIATDTADPFSRHRAIAEIAALSIRGLKTFADCDELVRAYFDELEAFPDALDLEGAAVTYNYSVAALRLHVTTISAEELGQWRSRLHTFVDGLLAGEPLAERPNRHADLLDLRGYLAFCVDALSGERPPIEGSIAYWKKLLDIAANAPLYPITRFADRLTQFATVLGEHDDFGVLAERTDELVAKRHGGFAAASKARDRAMQFYNKGDLPRAISELHRARVNWFAKETLGGSILAFLTISSWYREIGLNFAAKYYAFAAAFIAVMSEEAKVRKRFPHGLALAAESDYEQGAWCGYLDLVSAAERAAFAILPTTERELPDAFHHLVYESSMVIAITELLVPARVEYVARMTSRLALHEFVSELLDDARVSVGADAQELRARIEGQLVGPPFSDTGKTRSASWNAYGTEWRVHWPNTYAATPVAEEFCAALQIFLAEIYSTDLYLLATRVDIEINVQDGAAPSLRPSPSNDTRRWRVTLPPNQTAEGFDKLQQHIFAFGVAILTEISLLSQEELVDIIEAMYKKGLSTKTIVARPYSELFHKFVPEAVFSSSSRNDGPPAPDWQPPANSHLPWNDSDGWSYEPKDAIARVEARYQNSLVSLRVTLPRLRSAAAFQRTVAELRAKGWRDWHILMAVMNLTANLRVNALINAGHDPEAAFEEYRKSSAKRRPRASPCRPPSCSPPKRSVTRCRRRICPR